MRWTIAGPCLSGADGGLLIHVSAWSATGCGLRRKARKPAAWPPAPFAMSSFAMHTHRMVEGGTISDDPDARKLRSRRGPLARHGAFRRIRHGAYAIDSAGRHARAGRIGCHPPPRA